MINLGEQTENLIYINNNNIQDQNNIINNNLESNEEPASSDNEQEYSDDINFDLMRKIIVIDKDKPDDIQVKYTDTEGDWFNTMREEMKIIAEEERLNKKRNGKNIKIEPQRNFKNEWLQIFPDLQYNNTTNTMSCRVCDDEYARYRFKSSQNFRVTNIMDHTKTDDHVKALNQQAKKKLKNMVLDNFVSFQLNEKQFMVLIYMKTVLFQIKHNYSNNQYEPLLGLQQSIVDQFSDYYKYKSIHINKHHNNWYTHKEVMISMYNVVRQKQFKLMEENPYISISWDESPSKNKDKIMITRVKLLDYSKEPIQIYSGLFKLEKKLDSHTLSTEIQNNLNIRYKDTNQTEEQAIEENKVCKKIRFLAADSTNYNMGQKQSISQYMKSHLNGHILNSSDTMHLLSLVLEKVCDEFIEFQEVLNLSQQLYVEMGKFYNKNKLDITLNDPEIQDIQNIFTENVPNFQKTHKKISLVRVLGNFQVIEGLLQNYMHDIKVLQDPDTKQNYPKNFEREGGSKVNYQALLDSLLSLETQYTARIMFDYMQIFKKYLVICQQENWKPTQEDLLITDLKHELNTEFVKLKNYFDEKQLAYNFKCFNIDDMIQKAKQISNQSKQTDFIKEYGLKNIEELYSHYGRTQSIEYQKKHYSYKTDININFEKLSAQYNKFKQYIFQSFSKSTLVGDQIVRYFLGEKSYEKKFPQIYQLLYYSQIATCESVSIERDFSVEHIIHNDSRNQLEIDTIEMIMTIKLCQYNFENFPFDESIQEYLKSDRKNLKILKK